MQEVHNSQLHAVLRKLEKVRIICNMEKCEFSEAKPSKTAVVREMQEPTNVSELCSFCRDQLGKFILHLAEKDKNPGEIYFPKGTIVSGKGTRLKLSTL